MFLEKDAFDDERFKLSPSLPALEMPSAHAVAEKYSLAPWVMRALKSLIPFFRAQDTTHAPVPVLSMAKLLWHGIAATALWLLLHRNARQQLVQSVS